MISIYLLPNCVYTSSLIGFMSVLNGFSVTLHII